MQTKKKYIPRSKRLLRKQYRGQTMAVIGLVLALGVLIGLVAIAFDGGSALLQRRTMQNGAEAGALAGGNFLTNNLAVSCNPGPTCHPTYLVTNQQLLDQITPLTRANRGGTVGAADSDYTTLVEYHYMAGHVPPIAGCPDPGHGAGYCPMPQNPVYPFVPEFVDGLRVTSLVNNPTTFAKAIPNPLSNLTVAGKAAVLLHPTCAPQSQQGNTLPFTRYRPAVEKELFDANGGNSVCHVFPFWVSNPDIGSSNKNVMSFDHDTLHPHQNISQQMITGFDQRAGPVDPLAPWPGSGLSAYDHAQIGRTLQQCYGEPCVNMYNAGVPKGGRNPGAPGIGDLANWVFWQWRGTLSTGATAWNQLPHSETLYPSTRQNGANGTNPRSGDWTETEGVTGSGGNNIQDAVHDLADQYGVVTPLSTELNWGKAITRTIYVWGEPAPTPSTGVVPGDDKSAQVWDSWDSTKRNPCSGGQGNNDTFAWTDLNISGSYSRYDVSNASCGGNGGPSTNIDRVRFTKAYTFVFYANLQGNNYGADNAPGCPALPNSGSAAWGILPDIAVPDPGPGGGCPTGWEPGGGVYSQQIDPGP